jgi:hypothetical protein
MLTYFFTDKYYLVDSSYPNKIGYFARFKGSTVRKKAFEGGTTHLERINGYGAL